MKLLMKFTLFFLATVFSLFSCKKEQISSSISQNQLLPAVDRTCPVITWPLTAGQTIPAGTVTVTNDADNLYITYALNTASYPCAQFGTLHVWVGSSLATMPSNPQGHPIPGQFCQIDPNRCHDATVLTTYTFTIPWSSTTYVDITNACTSPIYVVTHAEVNGLDCSGGSHETAYGGPTAGGGNAWWFYGQYTACCESGPPNPEYCNTAFAKGGWVWTTGKKANPEQLPSLNLINNRWGWAINLTAPGTTTYPIWAGAGLNNTANGTLVGNLTIVWDGTTATVTYNMLSGFSMDEAHLYAADARPTTLAPGQFGNTAYFNPNATSYTFTVPLADTNGTDGVWLIAHAVSCTS
ncbi:MAG: hypothetical protein IT269_13490 [Saprospiraceae bacterium]|nr:hypothetical protein [Saprospiraceae bacterium]